jgi:hypothetical protein
MSAFGLLGVMVLSAVLVILAAVKWESGRDERAPPPSGMAGIEQVGEGESRLARMRWDAREGHGNNAAPALALLLRPTDVYGWWAPHLAGSIFDNRNPRGPDELHLSVIVPGADSVAPALFDPICAEADKPFAGCRHAVIRLIMHRLPFHTEAEKALVGMQEQPVPASLPYEQRPRRALLEFWTRAEPQGRRRFVGWECGGLRAALDNVPAEAALLAAAPDPRLTCFRPGWWERVGPGQPEIERHAIYFECAPKGWCEADFFFESRHVEVHFERGPVPPEPWLDLAIALASWETLERMRMDAVQAPAPAAALDEARAQMRVCEGLVEEGQRWIQHGGLADNPDGTRPFSEWQRASLPCHKASALLVALAEAEPGAMGPLLVDLGALLDSLGLRDTEPLIEARIGALERLKQGRSAAMLEALVDSLTYHQHGGEYDKDVARKAERVERAWQLALELQPPPPHETVQKVAIALAAMRYGQQDGYGRQTVYDQWLEWVDRNPPPSHDLLRVLDRVAGAHWSQNDFVGLKLLADRMRDTYLAMPPSLAEHQEQVAAGAFNAAFYYRNYAFRQGAFAEVAPSMDTVIAKMEVELGADNRFCRAARFHQAEVTRRQAAPDGTHIGGGFLD